LFPSLEPSTFREFPDLEAWLLDLFPGFLLALCKLKERSPDAGRRVGALTWLSC